MAHIPMTIHPDPQDVLIVGIGGGSTAGALTRHEPGRLDVVELSDTVVQSARYFGTANQSSTPTSTTGWRARR
jgi:spermidine synthase